MTFRASSWEIIIFFPILFLLLIPNLFNGELEKRGVSIIASFIITIVYLSIPILLYIRRRNILVNKDGITFNGFLKHLKNTGKRNIV